MTLFTLITGASSGIGLEMARVFAENGHSLILTARNVGKLEALAKELKSKYAIEVHVVPADLADPKGPKKLFDTIARKKLPVETLVNNAGFATYGAFADTNWSTERDMLQVNIVSPIELCSLFLPQMKERRSGSILNVASTAAFQPGPAMANYYASKAHILHFGEALSYELRPHHITVSTLCPGATRTAFFDVADMTKSRLANSPMLMNAEEVARAGYDGLRRGKVIVIPGFLNWFMATTVGLMPRAAVRMVTAMINQS